MDFKNFIILYLIEEYLKKVESCDECLCKTWCEHKGNKMEHELYNACGVYIVTYIKEMHSIMQNI